MSIADDIVEGLCCEQCQTYFVKAHGYPLLCKHCKRSDPGSPVHEDSSFHATDPWLEAYGYAFMRWRQSQRPADKQRLAVAYADLHRAIRLAASRGEAVNGEDNTMPTNDPTAPRVVGGGEPDALRQAFVAGYVKALGAEDDPWIMRQAALEASAIQFPAVLPEEGTTPPRLANYTCARPGCEARALAGSSFCPDHQEGTTPRTFENSGQRYRVTGYDPRAASSGESGAPTEELTNVEREALELAAQTLEAPSGKWSAPVSAGVLRRLASRLTRSPRAAGAPTGCTGGGYGGTSGPIKPACSRCGGSGFVMERCPGPAGAP